MARKLTLLFRRDPAQDRLEKDVRFEGYEVLWPDGRSAGSYVGRKYYIDRP